MVETHNKARAASLTHYRICRLSPHSEKSPTWWRISNQKYLRVRSEGFIMFLISPSHTYTDYKVVAVVNVLSEANLVVDIPLLWRTVAQVTLPKSSLSFVLLIANVYYSEI